MNSPYQEFKKRFFISHLKYCFNSYLVITLVMLEYRYVFLNQQNIRKTPNILQKKLCDGAHKYYLYQKYFFFSRKPHGGRTAVTLLSPHVASFILYTFLHMCFGSHGEVAYLP